MARLRFRFELDGEGRGVPLPRLAGIAQETQRFLRKVAEDVEADALKSDWVAVDFSNSLMSFNIEYVGNVDQDQVRSYTRAVRQIVSHVPNLPSVSTADMDMPATIVARQDTLLQFAKIADYIEPTESLNVGFYSNGEVAPDEWETLSKSSALAVVASLAEYIEYQGMIQGIIHSLYKESEPPYFDARQLSTHHIVKCYYKPQDYRTVVGLLSRKDAVVLIAGQIRARRIDRKIIDIHVERMRSTEPLSDAEFEQLQGAAPKLTGNLTTGEFVSRQRRRHGHAE